ncbi:hypothetical protein ACWCOP_08090 [Maricaulaceae bacterium MS644]
MRELTQAEINFVSGGEFTDGQCVAAGAGMGLAGGLGAIGAGMAVGSIVPGLGTIVGGIAGLVVGTAAGIFTWTCTESNNA